MWSTKNCSVCVGNLQLPQKPNLYTNKPQQKWTERGVLIYYSKTVHFLFSFLTLCLCFQYFHNDLLLFNKESALDPVADTFSTHGTTTGSADMFLRFRQPHENFWSHSTNASKSAWVHTTCRFWCFPNLLGIKVNNSITRGSGPRKWESRQQLSIPQNKWQYQY